MKNLSSIQNKHRWAQLLFLVLPTILVAGFLLWQANTFFTILRNQWYLQLLYFAVGITLGSLLFSGRLRFLTSFAVLVAGLILAYRFLDNVSIGEFDAFFISKQFLVFALLLSLGVFLGWGLQRYAFFSIVVSSFFFLLSIYLLSKTGEFTMRKIIVVLVPIIFYCIYLIFTSNELYRFKLSRTLSWSKLFKRLFFFVCLLFLVGAGVLLVMKKEIYETIEQYGDTKANDDNSMLKKNKDGTVKNQDQMDVARSGNKRSNELVFCAYIDNFFEGTEMPNPLYLTSHYFTQFDTLTETFERDKNAPFQDEFTPNPDDIPLFSNFTNTKVLDSAKATKMIEDVTIEVYKKGLAADAFLAPNTAYSVQPITVEKDFQNDYLYAYRAQSKVSKLNSAYFIYNSDDPMISAFQELRFEELRKAQTYQNTDPRFMDYYTFFPRAQKFSRFKTLADSLDKTAQSTIDKVLAIRSHFKQKNPLGEAVYTYSDNPGIPGLPGASKISNFMFETKKGWCTYYAGSTLLLLRAMKIPSRIAVGFLTIDRSDNNKGWYWFYQDQAHAWVQVYFPEYGWLDFDMTIGNDEAQQSPAPDGTPPMQPPKAVLVTSGEIKTVDTNSEKVTIQSNHFIYKEKEFKDINKQISLQLHDAKIWKDSAQISISDLSKNDYIVGVSYNEKYGYYATSTLESILSKLPGSIPVDEVYFKSKADKLKTNSTPKEKAPTNLWILLLKIALLFIAVTLFIFSMPYLILKGYAYRFKKSKKPRQAAYRLFRYTTYYLNQLGYSQKGKTLTEFAQHTVEPFFKNEYLLFAKHYQKTKFTTAEPTPSDTDFLKNYFSTFTQNIKQQIKPKERFKHFLKIKRAFTYFLSYASK